MQHAAMTAAVAQKMARRAQHHHQQQQCRLWLVLLARSWCSIAGALSSTYSGETDYASPESLQFRVAWHTPWSLTALCVKGLEEMELWLPKTGLPGYPPDTPPSRQDELQELLQQLASVKEVAIAAHGRAKDLAGEELRPASWQN